MRKLVGGFVVVAAVAAMAVWGAGEARGQEEIARWNADGANTAQGAYPNADSEVSGLVVSNLVAGTGLKPGGTTATDVFAAYDYTATSYAAALSGGDYWEFCLVPQEAVLTLSSLSFSFGGPKSGPQSAAWAWSTDRKNWTALETIDLGRTATQYFSKQQALGSLPSVEEPLWLRLVAWGGGTASSACGSFGKGGDVLTIVGSLASLKEAPVITFNPTVPEVGVSNTMTVAAIILPRTGSGVKSATLEPKPAGTYSIADGNLTIKPIAADIGKSFTYTVTATNAYGSSTESVVVQVIDYQVPGAVTLTFDTQSQAKYEGGIKITEPAGSGIQWQLDWIRVEESEDDQRYGGKGRALRFSNQGTAMLTSVEPVLFFHANTQGVSTVTWHVGVSGGLEEGDVAPTMSLEVSPDKEHWLTVDEFESGDYAADGSLVRKESKVGLAGPAYLRFRVEGNGVNVNLDQVVIEPADKLNAIDQYLLQYNVTPGDARTGPQEDYDGDGRSNLQERMQKKNPYLKD